MRRNLGRCLTSRCGLSCLTAATAAISGTMSQCDWPAGKAATYTRTGTAVASVISELPGERAEALFIAMAALVPTAGEQFTTG